MLPLAPGPAFDGPVDGAPFSSTYLSGELLYAVRIFQIDIFLAQPDDSQTIFMSNFAKVGVLGASKFEQNILTSATMLCPAMFWRLLFRSGSDAEAANLPP